MKPVVDKILAFAISKKLTVFVVATVLAFTAVLNGEQWVTVAVMYIGTQGAIDFLLAVLKLKSNENNIYSDNYNSNTDGLQD